MLKLCAWARYSRPASLLLFLCLLSTTSWADCPSPTSPAEYLHCASQNDPELLEARAQLEAQKASALSRGLWQNPQLAADVISAPEGQYAFGATWMQALPLSGVKGHAVREAAFRIQAAELGLAAKVQDRLATWVVDLARLRQIDEEMELLEQEQGLSQSALDRLARLAYQTAEQQAATKTFQWNQKALEASRLHLLSEQADLRQNLSRALGKKPDNWAFVLPHRQEWPDFPGLDLARAPEMLALQLEAQAAEAGLKRASASAWPDLSLGPVIEAEPSANGQAYFAGGALEIQLPLWDRNQGERGAARAEESWSKQKIALSTRALQGRMDLLRTRYEAAIPPLQRNMHALEDGLPSLRAINKAYLAGRLPVSTALEAFRQYHDAVEQNHRLERETLECLWQAYALGGTALTRKP